jgi:flagellar motor switch/type III secretory pathway protein FliN
LLSLAAREPQWFNETTDQRLRLSRANPSQWLTSPVTLDVSVGHLELPIALQPHIQWAELLLPAVRELPPQLIATIISHVLEPVTRAIAAWTDTSPQVARWPSQLESEARSMIAMHIGSITNDTTFEVLIPVLSPAVVNLFMNRSETSPCATSVSIRDLVAETTVELAQVALSNKELRSLNVGDIVALDCAATPSLPRSLPAKLCAGNSQVAIGTIRASSFLVDVFEWQFMAPLPPQNSQSAEDATAPIDDLTLNCRIVVPAGDVRIGDIAQWSVGTLITLPISVDSDRIALHVGQQLVARGRLVAIGEQLGFELIETFRR